MRHLTKEEIRGYVMGGHSTFKRMAIWKHVKSCPDCMATLEREMAAERALQAKLDKLTASFVPSPMMDAKVKLAIVSITSKPTRALLPRWVTSVASAAVVVLMSYGFFFYAPLFGAKRETAAQMVVSGMYGPVIKEAKGLVPTSIEASGATFEKLAFFNVLCDRYGVCAADRMRLINQGFAYSDVFISSLMSMALDLNSDDLLSLFATKKTPAQILSMLGVSFTSQISGAGQLKRQVDVTKDEIVKRQEVRLDVVQINGKVITPVPGLELPKLAQDGHYEARIDRDGKVTSVQQSKDNSFIKGEIVAVRLDKNELDVKATNGKTFTVKIGFETSMTRYNEPILAVQISPGQLVDVFGYTAEGYILATMVAVAEVDSVKTVKGTVVDIDNDFIAVRGFGLVLSLSKATKFAGKPQIGSEVELVAMGNDVQGYKVQKVTVTQKPTPPVADEKTVAASGVVVNVGTDDGGRRLFLLSDGTVVYYNKLTKIEGGKPEIGQIVQLVGVPDDGSEGKTTQITAKTVKLTTQTNPEAFAIAGDLSRTPLCLTSCNWVKKQGLTEIRIKGQSDPYLIYPETVGHDLITPNKVGQLVIIEGRRIGGVNLVDKAQVADPTKQIMRSGTIVSIDKDGILLDDGTKVHTKPYTLKEQGAVVGVAINATCIESDGALVAIKIELAQTEPVSTAWIEIASFENGMLTLADGTSLLVTAETKVMLALTRQKVDLSALAPGVKVACTYRKGSPNIALEVQVFQQ